MSRTITPPALCRQSSGRRYPGETHGLDAAPFENSTAKSNSTRLLLPRLIHVILCFGSPAPRVSYQFNRSRREVVLWLACLARLECYRIIIITIEKTVCNKKLGTRGICASAAGGSARGRSFHLPARGVGGGCDPCRSTGCECFARLSQRPKERRRTYLVSSRTPYGMRCQLLHCWHQLIQPC